MDAEYAWDDPELVRLVGVAATSEAWRREKAVLLPLVRRPGMRFFVRSDERGLVSMVAWSPGGVLGSFWTDPGRRGEGHLSGVLWFALGRVPLPARCVTRTPAAVRALERLGFVRVGSRGGFGVFRKDPPPARKK